MPYRREFQISFLLGFVRKAKKNQNKNKKILNYVTEQREGGDEVVFWLVVQNAALIQWHKLKKEIPSIAYIDILNGIIPGHAFKIR